jgi:hypothetical protein
MTRKLALYLGMGLLASTAMFAQTTTSNTSTITQSLPPFGLGSTETARLDLTNFASNTTGGTAASCTGTVSFYNAAATIIGTATTYTATAGQTVSVSLASTSAGFSGSRGELRVVITSTRTSGVPCELRTSFQTFDTSSGATHIYLGDVFSEVSGPIRGR